jgi:predicted aspartyl protease
MLDWRAALAGVVLTWAVVAPAWAQCVAAPELGSYSDALPADVSGVARSDRLGRVVAPVSVNGQGPFRFIVDTGANRSVLSQALADRLGLTASGEGQVHSVYGVSSAPVVQVNSLRYGDLAMGAGGPLPVFNGPMLAGEHGLLGVDGMAGRRLKIDFDRRCIEIVASRSARRLAGWTTVRGELRFGHLVLMRGRIADLEVAMFIDTGADTTLANPALRDQLRASARSRVRITQTELVRAYAAGNSIVLHDAMALRGVDLGDVEVDNVVAYVGDFHIFRIWGLTDTPALLIGMDVLSQTRGVAIDYERATVHFRLREAPRTGSRLEGPRSPGVTIAN